MFPTKVQEGFCKMFRRYKFEHHCLCCEHVQEDFLHTSCTMVHKCRKISYTRVAKWCTSAGAHTLKIWSFLSSVGNIQIQVHLDSFLINSLTSFPSVCRLLQLNLCTVYLCGNEAQACSAVHAHVTVTTNSNKQFVAMTNLLRCGKHHLLTW